jgi:hypothetical protein
MIRTKASMSTDMAASVYARGGPKAADRALRIDVERVTSLVWTTLIPAAEVTAHVLAEKVIRWFVLKWQVARPETPFAVGGVVSAGGLLSLVAAAMFARRMTAPLAGLVEATGEWETGRS